MRTVIGGMFNRYIFFTIQEEGCKPLNFSNHYFRNLPCTLTVDWVSIIPNLEAATQVKLRVSRILNSCSTLRPVKVIFIEVTTLRISLSLCPNIFFWKFSHFILFFILYASLIPDFFLVFQFNTVRLKDQYPVHSKYY